MYILTAAPFIVGRRVPARYKPQDAEVIIPLSYLSQQKLPGSVFIEVVVDPENRNLGPRGVIDPWVADSADPAAVPGLHGYPILQHDGHMGPLTARLPAYCTRNNPRPPVRQDLHSDNCLITQEPNLNMANPYSQSNSRNSIMVIITTLARYMLPAPETLAQ